MPAASVCLTSGWRSSWDLGIAVLRAPRLSVWSWLPKGRDPVSLLTAQLSGNIRGSGSILFSAINIGTFTWEFMIVLPGQPPGTQLSELSQATLCKANLCLFDGISSFAKHHTSSGYASPVELAGITLWCPGITASFVSFLVWLTTSYDRVITENTVMSCYISTTYAQQEHEMIGPLLTKWKAGLTWVLRRWSLLLSCLSSGREIRIKNCCIVVTYKPQNLSFIFLYIKMASCTLMANQLSIAHLISSATPISLNTVFT